MRFGCGRFVRVSVSLAVVSFSFQHEREYTKIDELQPLLVLPEIVTSALPLIAAGLEVLRVAVKL